MTSDNAALWEGPLAGFDVSDPRIFQRDEQDRYFARLRAEDPVHCTESAIMGRYWSVTRYHDIKAVDTDHRTYSSALGGITIGEGRESEHDPTADVRPFITMDPPEHEAHRMAVTPAVSAGNLANLEQVIRDRVCAIIDSLPQNEAFNWVERVSIELTASMLATLFDFPHEQRASLIRWSDMASSLESLAGEDSIDPEARAQEMMACVAAFSELWMSKVNQPPAADLISLLIHNEATKGLIEQPVQLLGTLLLLIVGGNDTTRNTISGGLYALSQYPDEFAKVRENRALIPSMVAEMIRWQTPVLHMRRTTTKSTELAGKEIPAGEQVIMWYVSGNRDESVFPDAHRFDISRPNVRQHLSFGYGIHRCMGNRLAEMQLRVLWEELLSRGVSIEVLDAPTRIASNFIRGISNLPVKLSFAN